MAKKEVSEKEKNLIIKKLSAEIKKDKNIKFAYIFGSFVTEKEFADIDLGVYVDENNVQDYLSFELKLEEKLKFITKQTIDVRVINCAPISFAYQVIKEGILILDKDVSQREDFQGLVFKKYFDFIHLRQEYLKEVINAPI